VEAAGATSVLPLSGTQTDVSYVVEGRIPPEGEEPAADYRAVTPGYLETLEVPLVSGRLFRPGDDAEGQPVVLVSRELVRRAFDGEDPLGRRIRVGDVRNPEATWRTIVGVVDGVRDNALALEPDPEVYLPVAQAGGRLLQIVARSRTLDPEALGAAVRRAVTEADGAQPISNLGAVEERVRATLAPERFVTGLLTVFAALALVLAAVGLYGVMAYAVGRRTREIGIRMALGARPGSVLGLVLRQGGLLLAGGLAAGAFVAWGLTRLLGEMLYGVEPFDPATVGAMAAVLAVTALAASWLPARRAARVDPVDALRTE
jgi:putative ABC transport system permease protein